MIINSLDDALLLLRVGGVIAYPTETFYGIGCGIYNNESLNRIYEIKGRASNMPLPLIVANNIQALEHANISKEVENSFLELTTQFWPGSLSICLKTNDKVSKIITANTGTMVVRQSPHELAHALCTGLGSPIVSTSANISGKPAAKTAQEVDINLAIDAVLDIQSPQQRPQGGLASTIINLLENKTIQVIRDGAFDTKQLEEMGYIIKK